MRQNENSHGVPSPSEAPPPTRLQREAMTAPEAEWFSAWVKSATQYLVISTAYLGAAGGFVAVWKKLIAGPGETADPVVWASAGVVALPLLFGLLFNLLPAWRRRRERRLRPRSDPGRELAAGYFDAAPRRDDSHGFFMTGYEPFLDWLRHPPAPLLHLTGLSGSGKSSLLNAYLKPNLEQDADTEVVVVRSYGDPLAALKDALSSLWKGEPADYDALTPVEALRRASKLLSGDRRLLVAFDQFEEFFLLRATAPPPGDQAKTAAPVTTPDGTTTALGDFLHAFIAEPPEGVALLLAYREDHRRLVGRLGLPLRRERTNWMTLDPLDFAEAERFLGGCPGLSVPPERMNRALREAARQEGGRVVMRPIVANVLGLILRQMVGHPTLWRRSGDLLRGYVAASLGKELKEERGRLLQALLTDFHTARPRPVGELARETGLSATEVNDHLEKLGHHGLVRCLAAEGAKAEQCVWQVSHDFVATLIERVLDGLHRTFWRTIRPWLAPSAAVLAVILVFVAPWVQKQRAISLLANAGFTWRDDGREIAAGTPKAHAIVNLHPLSAAMRRLRPASLDLRDCALRDVDALEELSSLESLDLAFCNSLGNVDGLRRLTALESLNLSYCGKLDNANGLRRLRALTSLDLSGCVKVEEVDGLLKSLVSLRSLELYGCDVQEDVAGLRELTALTFLDLSCCDLRTVDGLRELTALTSLELNVCLSLKDVDGLRKLAALTSLKLIRCESLRNVDGLKELTALTSLELKKCKSLQNVNGLKKLSKALEVLDLSDCGSLDDVSGLKELTALKSLDLSWSKSLRNVDVLKDVTALESLDLSGHGSLENLAGLKELSKLRSLNLEGCRLLPKQSLRELASALPNTRIILPDGPSVGPPVEAP